jgi:SAM-dependent methyltransferase
MDTSFFSTADTSWWDPESSQDKRDFVYLKQLNWAISNLPVNIKGKALDIGAGRGRFTRVALNKGYDVISIDVNKKMFTEMEKLGLKNEKIVMKGEELNFKDNTFDVVFAMEVTMHIPQIEKFLKEIYRVLKPKGLAFLNITNKNSIYPNWVTKVSPTLSAAQKEYPRIQYEPKVFANHIINSDLKIIDQSGYGVVPPLSMNKNWKGTVLPRLIARPLSSIFDPYLGCKYGFCYNFLAQK